MDRKNKYDSNKRSEHHTSDYYRDVMASRIKSSEISKMHYYKDIEKSCRGVMKEVISKGYFWDTPFSVQLECVPVHLEF